MSVSKKSRDAKFKKEAAKKTGQTAAPKIEDGEGELTTLRRGNELYLLADGKNCKARTARLAASGYMDSDKRCECDHDGGRRELYGPR